MARKRRPSGPTPPIGYCKPLGKNRKVKLCYVGRGNGLGGHKSRSGWLITKI